MRDCPFSRSGRGFTFLELMVSLALVSLLMAFLFPLLLQGRHSARRAACQSNLAQLGAALHLYAQDYDGHFPAVKNDWTAAALIYAKNQAVLKCPDEPQDLIKRYDPGNAHMSGEGATLHSSYTYRPGLTNDDPAEEAVSTDWGSWHGNGLNVLYLGGNIRWKPKNEAPNLQVGPRPLPTGVPVAPGDLLPESN